MDRLVSAARAGGAARPGDIDAAARCELALLGIRRPTPEQLAGAMLRAWHHEDTRVLAHGKVWKNGGGEEE